MLSITLCPMSVFLKKIALNSWHGTFTIAAIEDVASISNLLITYSSYKGCICMKEVSGDRMYIAPEKHGVKYMRYMGIFFLGDIVDYNYSSRKVPHRDQLIVGRYHEGTAMPS